MGKLEEQEQDTAQDADKNFPTDSGVPVTQNVTSRSRRKPNEFFFICIPLCSDIFHVLLQKTGPAVLPSPVFSLFINMVLFLENQS